MLTTHAMTSLFFHENLILIIIIIIIISAVNALIDLKCQGPEPWLTNQIVAFNCEISLANLAMIFP